MPDPPGWQRVTYKKDQVKKLKEWMKNPSPRVNEYRDFTWKILNTIMPFLEEKEMTIEELQILLEKGREYAKTLQKTENSDAFKEVHFDLAKVWIKW